MSAPRFVGGIYRNKPESTFRISARVFYFQRGTRTAFVRASHGSAAELAKANFLKTPTRASISEFAGNKAVYVSNLHLPTAKLPPRKMPAHATASAQHALTVTRAARGGAVQGGLTVVPTEVLICILRFAFDRDAHVRNKRAEHAVATLLRMSRVSSKMRRVVYEFATLYVQSQARFHLWPRYVSYYPSTTAPVLSMRNSRAPSILHICLRVVFTLQQRHCTARSTNCSASWMQTRTCITFCSATYAQCRTTWWLWMPFLSCRSSIEHAKKAQHTCMSAAGA